ncbi:hypothetical protein DFP72DRAFT_585458 [Ephemerocybe angulata]|uniref:Uncharacterized protein n=1 Tax=Ephemerocybe angulata TaxID=980116 RepID=A0A8H6HK32_9AGAR|nr:hypothetical protein DFP72DRAFT_585458 [Tulosesus angulatus]
MPPRRPQQEDIESEGLDLDLLQSQSSNSDESAAFEKALLQHYAATKEKKRQEKEKKFIEQASTLLKKDISKTTQDIQTTSQSIEKVYAKFLNNYAATEDRIHHLWAAVLKEHQTLQMAIKKKYEVGETMASDADKQHISGLSRMKAACQEYDTIVALMVPQVGDDLDGMDQD